MASRKYARSVGALEVGGFARRSVLQQAYEATGGTCREEETHWWRVARSLWWGRARQAQTFLDGPSRSIVLAASCRRVVELEYGLLTVIGEGHR